MNVAQRGQRPQDDSCRCRQSPGYRRRAKEASGACKCSSTSSQVAPLVLVLSTAHHVPPAVHTSVKPMSDACLDFYFRRGQSYACLYTPHDSSCGGEEGLLPLPSPLVEPPAPATGSGKELTKLEKYTFQNKEHRLA